MDGYKAQNTFEFWKSKINFNPRIRKIIDLPIE